MKQCPFASVINSQCAQYESIYRQTYTYICVCIKRTWSSSSERRIQYPRKSNSQPDTKKQTMRPLSTRTNQEIVFSSFIQMLHFYSPLLLLVVVFLSSIRFLSLCPFGIPAPMDGHWRITIVGSVWAKSFLLFFIYLPPPARNHYRKNRHGFHAPNRRVSKVISFVFFSFVICQFLVALHPIISLQHERNNKKKEPCPDSCPIKCDTAGSMCH